MTDYNVVCRGEILPGSHPETAKRQFAALFKLAPETLEPLWSGESLTVKRNTDRRTAERYRQAAGKCGILFHVLPSSGRQESGEASGHIGDAGMSVQVSRSMKCPHCGFRQGLSNTCIRCGNLVIEREEKRSDRNPGPASGLATPGPVKKASSESSPPQPPQGLFRKSRIAILTATLIIVGLSSWMTHLHVTGWKEPLAVAIYPINGDGSDTAAAYIAALGQADFDAVSDYFVQEAKSYELPLSPPFAFVVADEIDELPPNPPAEKRLFDVIWWSLKFRYWAYSSAWQEGISPDIKLFVLYYDPQDNALLDHSLGLKKGMIGIVHAYAAEGASWKNQVIIAHEILHTVGATDKYDPETHQPVYPDGYAEPDRNPRHPQALAEIMGSRIPVSPSMATMPPDLDHTVIGSVTAQEIRWVD